ncbi:MAG TPA: 30S ribosome-binding factor RbfA [Firmicutes bacterium]|jgi:ribosome-binding factor A|nr:30S ribosome-binding factor RbfA [Bacillota bacterium]
MGKLRVAKLEVAIQQEIGELIQRELKDPRIGFASVTKVTVSGDLRYANVYVSVLGNDEEKKETLEGLGRATGFIRHELGQRIRLRYTPELTFHLDESIAHGIELTNFIDRLQEGAEKNDNTPPSRDKKRPKSEP